MNGYGGIVTGLHAYRQLYFCWVKIYSHNIKLAMQHPHSIGPWVFIPGWKLGISAPYIHIPFWGAQLAQFIYFPLYISPYFPSKSAKALPIPLRLTGAPPFAQVTGRCCNEAFSWDSGGFRRSGCLQFPKVWWPVGRCWHPWMHRIHSGKQALNYSKWLGAGFASAVGWLCSTAFLKAGNLKNSEQRQQLLTPFRTRGLKSRFLGIDNP